MQRKRELKFYATNTHQFPLILDAWLQRRGGETTWTNLQTKIFLFWSRDKQNDPFSKKFLLKRTEGKNGFCDTVFAVLIQKKALEEEDKEEVRSIDRG